MKSGMCMWNVSDTCSPNTAKAVKKSLHIYFDSHHKMWWNYMAFSSNFWWSNLVARKKLLNNRFLSNENTCHTPFQTMYTHTHTHTVNVFSPLVLPCIPHAIIFDRIFIRNVYYCECWAIICHRLLNWWICKNYTAETKIIIGINM